MLRPIYFCGSIRGGRQDRETYAILIQFLSQYGAVLTEHIGEENIMKDLPLSDQEIHDRDMDWLKQSKLVVAEVSQPSLGVGYEIGRALEMGKSIICLYRVGAPNQLSAMISGCSGIHLISYGDVEEALQALQETLSG